MVCIYCGALTRVANSRHQQRTNTTWRRRECLTCHATFTTIEANEMVSNFVVEDNAEAPPLPFSRDRLFLSIFESCRHRTNPIEDATALTKTIIAQLNSRTKNARISRQMIISTAQIILERFDPTAATVYRAYHPLA